MLQGMLIKHMRRESNEDTLSEHMCILHALCNDTSMNDSCSSHPTLYKSIALILFDGVSQWEIQSHAYTGC